jgi:glycosyltransferase involved in cell wall biosynthesis
MFKVADYLIQSQTLTPSNETAKLRALDTRGGGSAVGSFWFLAVAIVRLIIGRITRDLAGVHVNMAERLSLLRKGVMIAACRALGIPVVLHLHAAELHHFYRKLPRAFQTATRWIFSLPACVIVLGETSKNFVIDELKVSPDRVEIVINGVPAPKILKRSKLPGEIQQIFFLGNLSERKGVSDLLQALALPGFHRNKLRVILAGGGDIASYEIKAKNLGISELVKFEGWTEQARVAQLMAESDVLVLPSYDEGLPLAILEGLACGVAVVCSPVGEIPSVLQDNVNACFVRPGDVPGLAKALQRVLYESDLMSKISANGRTLYDERFSMSRFFASIALIHKRHFGIAAKAGSHVTPKPEFA